MDQGILSPSDQRRLAERVFSGDRSAEEELVRWFHPRVFTTLIRRTGDRESSRDVAQEVLIATLRTLREGGLDDPERLTQFVHGVVRNLANNHIRTLSIRRPREHALPPDLAERLAAPIREAEDETAAMEQAVARALEGLEPGDREILLATMQGQKPREIARAMALSSDVIRQRKSRALQRIRDSIQRLSRIASRGYLTPGKEPE
jgi:RNA polymerase sigma factor (sigma-70 family)